MGRNPTIILLLTMLGVAAPAAADDRAVPYWVSIRAEEVNMRVGPARDYPVVWVYHRQHLPMKVLRLKEGWRMVEDPSGERGWMLAQFLSPERSAVVTGKGLAVMRAQASPMGKLLWRLEPGVVGRLGECKSGWCRLTIGGHGGFVEEARLWGVGDP